MWRKLRPVITAGSDDIRAEKPINVGSFVEMQGNPATQQLVNMRRYEVSSLPKYRPKPWTILFLITHTGTIPSHTANTLVWSTSIFSVCRNIALEKSNVPENFRKLITRSATLKENDRTVKLQTSWWVTTLINLLITVDTRTGIKS